MTAERAAMSETLCHLVYTSHSTLEGDAPFIRREVDDLLEVARANNARRGITGALLLTGDKFAQVLEGSAAAITEVYLRILEDDRHRKVRLLSLEPIEARTFVDWSMAYVGDDPALAHEFGELTATFGSEDGHLGGEVVTRLLARHLGQPVGRR